MKLSMVKKALQRLRQAHCLLNTQISHIYRRQTSGIIAVTLAWGGIIVCNSQPDGDDGVLYTCTGLDALQGDQGRRRRCIHAAFLKIPVHRPLHTVQGTKNSPLPAVACQETTDTRFSTVVHSSYKAQCWIPFIFMRNRLVSLQAEKRSLFYLLVMTLIDTNTYVFLYTWNNICMWKYVCIKL